MPKNKEIFTYLGKTPKDKIVNVILIMVIVVLIGFAIWYAYKKLKNIFTDANKDLKEEISSGGKLSFSGSEYSNMADSLHGAMKGLGTNTDTVYSVFYKLNTKADVLQLIVSFGVRGGENLSQWMNGEYKIKVSTINSILASKGIDYTF